MDTKVKESLLLFIKHHPKYKIYYEEVYLLFYSGVRVSELCGLTTKNLDFENEIINLDHQLQYDSHYGLYITSLKGRLSSSEVKTRSIPMYKGVFEALETIIRNRPIVDEEVIIQSEDPRIPAQSGFVILNQTGNPRYSKFYDNLFQDICRDYNLTFPDHPIKITPHMCRHTFCTNIAEEGVDINLIQKLMGHTDVKTTQKYMKTFENQKVAEKTKYLNEKNW